MSAGRFASRRSTRRSATTWRIAPGVRDRAAPELIYCEFFAKNVSFDQVALTLALSIEEAWVLEGSDTDLVQLVAHEQTVLQGPHTDVLEGNTPVRLDHVRDAASRWPLLAASGGLSAVAARTILAVPLCSAQIPPIGTFLVARDREARFSEQEAVKVAEFARLMAGMLLLRWQAVRDVDRLEGLIHDHRHLAAGMLASYLGIPTQEAMAILRARAFSESRTLAGLSADIVLYLGTSPPP